MSLSRNLVDLYVLASAATKVGTSVLASQTNAVCMHVKTSSLLNPTPISQHQQPDQPTTQTPLKHIEVPFPDFVEKEASKITMDTPVTGTVALETVAMETTVALPPIKAIQPVKTSPITTNEKAIEATKIEPTSTTIVEKVEPTTTTIALEETPTAEKIVEETRKQLKESRIPTSRFSRMWNYGTLATGMGMGAINESFKRATGLSTDSSGMSREKIEMKGYAN